jgi:hypothetical protein
VKVVLGRYGRVLHDWQHSPWWRHCSSRLLECWFIPSRHLCAQNCNAHARKHKIKRSRPESNLEQLHPAVTDDLFH